MDNEVLVVTTENVPGYKVTKVAGEVFGLTTRSRHVGSSIGQSLKTIVGGEIKGYTELQHQAREQAIERMKDEARKRDCNAVVMMRFDTNAAVTSADSVAAYGTAVRIEPIE